MADDFDLRELLGDDPEAEARMPHIEDVPPSQLTVTSVTKEEKIDARVKAASDPHYIENGSKVEPLGHRIPTVTLPTSEPEGKPVMLSPDFKDEIASLDEEYYATFNGTIEEIKDLEPEKLQELRHRLERMIRRAKIQQRAIRVTEEGKLSLIDEKRRAKIKANDAEFMARKRAQGDADAQQTATKKPRASKSSDAGLSAAERQVKQFVKLMMDEATIRTTLASVGTPIPANLTELIAKFRK